MYGDFMVQGGITPTLITYCAQLEVMSFSLIPISDRYHVRLLRYLCTEGLEILQRKEAKKWLQYFQRRCNISHAVAIFPISKNTGIRVFIEHKMNKNLKVITIMSFRADSKRKFKARISHNP